MKYTAKYSSTESDNLIISADIPVMTIGVGMLPDKGIVKRGSVLTKDANGLYRQIEALTETPEGVLTDDVDTDNDTSATMYRQGHFNAAELLVGEDITNIYDLETKLRNINVILDEMV